jgi:hypothetical protein
LGGHAFFTPDHAIALFPKFDRIKEVSGSHDGCLIIALEGDQNERELHLFHRA